MMVQPCCTARRWTTTAGSCLLLLVAILPKLHGSAISGKVDSDDAVCDCGNNLSPDDPTNRTCILKEPQTQDYWTYVCDWDGDLVIADNVVLESPSELRLNATGEVRFGRNVAAISYGSELLILGRSVRIMENAIIGARGHTRHSAVRLGGNTCRGGISIQDGVQISGDAIAIECPGGDIEFSCSTPCKVQTRSGQWAEDKYCQQPSAVFASSVLSRAGVTVSSQSVVIPSRNVTIYTDVLQVVAARNATVAGNLVPGLATVDERGKTDQGRHTCSFLFAGEHLHLGHKSGNWVTTRFVAVAARVSVAEAHRIETKRIPPRCDTTPVQNVDRCGLIFNEWALATPNEWWEAVGGPNVVGDDVPMKFDVLIAARSQLQFQAEAQIWGASMLLCSGGPAFLEHGFEISARGRGCPPGAGPFRTISGWCRAANSPNCGASGGYMMGSGGTGAEYVPSSLSAQSKLVSCCQRERSTTDFNYDYLPTTGASGGGCYTTNNPKRASYGGGLIWLSASQLHLEAGVSVTSDGTDGDLVLMDLRQPQHAYMASGGGAGGHIIVFTSALVVQPSPNGDTTTPSFSAKGGDGTCNPGSKAVSGGGGGGFIGLQWTSAKRSSESKLGKVFTYNVAGGTIPENTVCRQMLPSNYSILGLENVLGESGLATALAPCGPGHGGIFCTRCETGKWNAGKDKVCRACTNKRGRSEYTEHTWTTEDCPYRCVDGLLNVSVNPECTCSPGTYGDFCEPCGLGQWSPRDSDMCFNCSNKPGPYSAYSEEAWPNSSCPYVCTGGVPNEMRNPLCHSTVDYVILKAGGPTFVRRAFVVLLLSAGAVIFYSNARKQARRRAARLQEKRRESHGILAHSQNWRFTHESLPYHICRVFLCGENRKGCPWSVNENPPILVEQSISRSQWQQFVSRLNKKAKIKFWFGWLEILVTLLVLPASVFFSLWLRRRRASAIRKLVLQSSDADDEKMSVWLPSAQSSTKALAMRFSCDDGATLAYIDFFDFSFSLFDWKPVDLRMEARLLIAHGHGSYAEPMALDVSDPLVEQVAQAGFGAPAVYSVVFAFNRLARLVPSTELEWDAERPTLAQLQARVEQCGSRCGLNDVAQVLLVRQACRKGKKKLVTQAPPAGDSFSDLVSQLKDGNRGALVPESGKGAPDADFKLCLAFMDRRAGSSSSQSCSPSRLNSDTSLEGPPPVTPLTSPMQHSMLASHNATDFELFSFGRGYVNPVGMATRFNSIRSCLCLTAVLAPGSMQNVILFALVVFMLTDAMTTVFLASLLADVGTNALIVWMFVPPMAPLLSNLTGVFFVFFEMPRLGRVSATLVSISCVNTVLASILVDVFNAMLFACILKVALYCAMQLHVRNIEANLDLSVSFTDTSAGSFVDGMLKPEKPQAVSRLSRMFRGDGGSSHHEREIAMQDFGLVEPRKDSKKHASVSSGRASTYVQRAGHMARSMSLMAFPQSREAKPAHEATPF